jgi:hypothetical protein
MECFATRVCDDLVQQGCWRLLSSSMLIKMPCPFYDYLLTQIGVPKDNIFLLTNQQATLVNVRRTLGTEFKRKASPRDTKLIYFAGHSAPATNTTSPDNDGLERIGKINGLA